jgi:hypothetical protein
MFRIHAENKSESKGFIKKGIWLSTLAQRLPSA